MRVQQRSRIAVGTVMKADVVGYKNGRSESEVVVLPECVSGTRVMTVDEFDESRKVTQW